MNKLRELFGAKEHVEDRPKNVVDFNARPRINPDTWREVVQWDNPNKTQVGLMLEALKVLYQNPNPNVSSYPDL